MNSGIQELNREQMITALQAVRAGQLEPSDVEPARHVCAIQHDGELYEVGGQFITEDQLNEIRESMKESNARRERCGLHLHSVHVVLFEDFSMSLISNNK